MNFSWVKVYILSKMSNDKKWVHYGKSLLSSLLSIVGMRCEGCFNPEILKNIDCDVYSFFWIWVRESIFILNLIINFEFLKKIQKTKTKQNKKKQKTLPKKWTSKKIKFCFNVHENHAKTKVQKGYVLKTSHLIFKIIYKKCKKVTLKVTFWKFWK